VLHDGPFFVEKAGPVEKVKALEQIFVGHPEQSVVAEFVVELLQPVWCPLARAI
jgi:hypothetical protein